MRELTSDEDRMYVLWDDINRCFWPLRKPKWYTRRRETFCFPNLGWIAHKPFPPLVSVSWKLSNKSIINQVISNWLSYRSLISCISPRPSQLWAVLVLLQAGLSSVCFKGASHGDVYLKHTEHTLWWKVSAYWSCIAIFLADVCFLCLKGASHGDVSWRHTDNAFRWEIMKSYIIIFMVYKL